MLKELSSNPKKLFLIDGLGAILSGFLYLVVLANFIDVFGIPLMELYFLSVLAGFYAFYSLTCYLSNLDNWQPYMKIISFANLFHSSVTIGLVIYYYYQITVLGLIYFAGELIIVVSLAILEFKMANKSIT